MYVKAIRRDNNNGEKIKLADGRKLDSKQLHAEATHCDNTNTNNWTTV